MAKVFRLRTKVIGNEIEFVCHKRAARGRYAACPPVRLSREDIAKLGASRELLAFVSGKAPAAS